MIRVLGTVASTALDSFAVEVGRGDAPDTWREVGRVEGRPVDDGVLFDIPASVFTERGAWMIRVVAIDRHGNRREARGTLTIG